MGQLSSKRSRFPFHEIIDTTSSSSIIKPTTYRLPTLDISVDETSIFLSGKFDLQINRKDTEVLNRHCQKVTELGQTYDPHGDFKLHELGRVENHYRQNRDSGTSITIGKGKTIQAPLFREDDSSLHSKNFDDMHYIATYLKSTEQDYFSIYSSVNESCNSLSSHHQKSGYRPVLSTRRSADHVSSLKPSRAYQPSLRPSASLQSLSSRSNYKTTKGRRLLSRQDSHYQTATPSLVSNESVISTLWSPTSEITENYRIALITNPHYCTYGCKDLSFKRKSRWIQHEEEHELPTIYTCLLHASESFESSPCPGKYCVSVMDFDHLAHFHDSLVCFEKPSISIERYESNKAGDLLDHLRERHGLEFDSFPDHWSSESRRRWRCGFCGGGLTKWQERVDHISLHFTREGLTMEAWKWNMSTSK